MEVQWDAERFSLYSPVPREWSYSQWFAHILAAAREQGTHLEVTDETVWMGIDLGMRNEMLAVASRT